MSVASPSLAANSRTRTAAPPPMRAVVIRWLRQTHGWIGLWGATLGLLFGFTGVFMNHRAVLKIPVPQARDMTVQLPLPQPAPADADALGVWLKNELKLGAVHPRVRVEPAHPVAWGDHAVMQPAHWSVTIGTPKENVQADYWAGDAQVAVKRSENGLLPILMNLHKGVGLGVGWILLVDTLAGSIMLLSLSGVALWILTHRRKTLGLSLFAGSTLLLIGLAVAAVV